MRHWLLVLPLLLGQVPAAQAQVSVDIGIGIHLPGVNIGINLPIYPDLQRVPGYPVYYAPQVQGNYFYYDGLYWVFERDEWYASSWYNGPWRRVMPDYVPVYVLRVPVRYYRLPPPYFVGWRPDAHPRWDQHWGREWQQRRPDWDRWDRRATPPPAPLPTYQRRYPQSRYPQEAERQRAIREESFRYQPREPVARQAYQVPDRPAPRPAPMPTPRVQAPSPQPGARPPQQQREQPQQREQQTQQQQQQQRERPAPAPQAQPPRSQAAPPDRGPPPGRGEPSSPGQGQGQGQKSDDRGRSGESSKGNQKGNPGGDRKGGD